VAGSNNEQQVLNEFLWSWEHGVQTFLESKVLLLFLYV